MKHIDENILLQQLKEPHTRRKAFEEMVRHFSPLLYWQIRRLVFTHDDADDLLQNTFMKAWVGLDSFRGKAKLTTWLYRIALNESLSFLRQKNEALTLDDSSAFPAYSLQSDPYFDGDETQLLLQQAIESLPPRQRIIFTMKYYKEMKYEEISEILQTSVGALKASYHIAVKKIETYFQEHD